MTEFRKKPIIIEAIRTSEVIAAATDNWLALPAWLSAAYEAGNVLLLPGAIEIATLEGRMRAESTDWIIRGVQGELYPCKPDIFEATYERLGEDSTDGPSR
jgi:hypothetical protein